MPTLVIQVNIARGTPGQVLAHAQEWLETPIRRMVRAAYGSDAEVLPPKVLEDA